MIGGALAIVVASLAFLVPFAVPLFVRRWRTLAIVVAVAAAIFGWLYVDIEATGATHWLGTFLAGLMFLGFGFGAIAKVAILLGRPPER